MADLEARMKGSEFVASLPESYSKDGDIRDSMILQAIAEGNVRPITWSPVHLEMPGHSGTAWVMSDALGVGDADDWVRINASQTMEQEIADMLGLRLLTAKLADEIHKQAGIVIRPAIDPVNLAADDKMADTSRMLLHHQKVQEKLSNDYHLTDLISTVGKDWIITNQIAGFPNKGANYGWHDRLAKTLSEGGLPLWQQVGLAHNRFHADYSQVVRLVSPDVMVDDQWMTYEDVLTSPELSPLLSYEGPMKITRSPGVAPIGAVFRASPEPSELEQAKKANWLLIGMGAVALLGAAMFVRAKP